MGNRQFNFRLDENLIEQVRQVANKENISVTQFLIQALNLRLGKPAIEEQSNLSLEAIDERIEASLDYRLLDIRDSLAANLDETLAEKLANIEKRLEECSQKLSDQHLYTWLEAGLELTLDQALDKKLTELNNSVNSKVDELLNVKLAPIAERLANQDVAKFPSKLKEISNDNDKLIICKLDNNDRGNSSKWRYFAGFKEGFVEQLDQARTYDESTVRQMGGRIAKSPHAASEGEMISWRSLAELKQLVVHA